MVLNRPPGAPAALEPGADALVATATPTLKVNPASDPDGQPLGYVFRVATNPDGTGGFVHSPLLTSTEWTVPAGVLRNGVTYYWQVYSFDGQLYGASALRGFRVEQRLGSGGPSPTESSLWV